MGPQFPGLTLALRENLLPVLAGQTVHPVLLRLTVSHLFPQSYKLLRHLDSLDVPQCVVALSSKYESHGVCGIVIFISTVVLLFRLKQRVGVICIFVYFGQSYELGEQFPCLNDQASIA